MSYRVIRINEGMMPVSEVYITNAPSEIITVVLRAFSNDRLTDPIGELEILGFSIETILSSEEVFDYEEKAKALNPVEVYSIY